MKYELSHDSIAHQIFEKASTEAKARRRVSSLVERALERYQRRGVLLTQEDIDEIKPFERTIHFSKEATRFIQESKLALEKEARRRRRITTAIISILSILLLIALWSANHARQSARAQKAMRLALQAEKALDNGQTSLGFRLAEAAHRLSRDSATQSTINEVMARLVNGSFEGDLTHEGQITALDWSPDDSLILSAGADGRLKLWSPEGKLIRSMSHLGPVWDAAFDPRGNFIVSVSEDSTAMMWTANGDTIALLRHPGRVLQTAFHPRQSTWLTVTDNNYLHLFDKSGKQLLQKAFPDSILNAEFAYEGMAFMVAFPAGVQVFALVGPMAIPKYKLSQEVKFAQFIQAEKLKQKLIVQGPDRARVYDVRGQFDTLPPYSRLNRHLGNYLNVRRIDYSHFQKDDPKVIFTTSDSLALWWSVYKNDPSGAIDFSYQSKGQVTYAGFSQTDRYVLLAETPGEGILGALSEKSLGSDSLFMQVFKRSRKLPALIKEAEFSSNDQWLVTYGEGNSAQLWNLHRKKETPLDNDEWMLYFKEKVRGLTIVEQQQYQLK